MFDSEEQAVNIFFYLSNRLFNRKQPRQSGPNSSKITPSKQLWMVE